MAVNFSFSGLTWTPFPPVPLLISSASWYKLDELNNREVVLKTRIQRGLNSLALA